MFQEVKVSPSILSADFMDLGSDVSMLESSGADWIHVDVMDGHFVPNLTMGIPLVKQLKRTSELPLDVHLMIDNPLRQIPWFIDAGADIITVHVEALSEEELLKAVEMIQAAGLRAGVSVKPGTEVKALLPVLEDLDMVLVMSVEPGFSGQRYIEGSEEKVHQVVELAEQKGASPLIQVDGGIGLATLGPVVEAGADVLVCGNAIFAQNDPASACRAIKESAQTVQRQAKR